MKNVHCYKASSSLTVAKIAGLLSLATMSSVAQAGMYAPAPAPATEPVALSFTDHLYVGIFGGAGSLSSTNASQKGTALLDTDDPLAVDAKGDSNSTTMGMIGMNLGYKWSEVALKSGSAWSLVPAAELEGYYMWGTQDANEINNATDRLDEHNFQVSYPMNTGVFLINGILNFNHTESKWHPYVGAGVGTAIVAINGATSTQIDPAEPGVNHYNSDTGASDWTFAAQAKAGLRYALTEKVGVFAEYRFLYLAPTDYTFGATEYPTHSVTTNWDVDMGDMYYNMFTVGVQYDA